MGIAKAVVIAWRTTASLNNVDRDYQGQEALDLRPLRVHSRDVSVFRTTCCPAVAPLVGLFLNDASPRLTRRRISLQLLFLVLGGLEIPPKGFPGRFHFRY
jgi:hypothetical protein